MKQTMSYRLKLLQPICRSAILLPRLNLSLFFFRQFSSHLSDKRCVPPDLLSHKDWLSQPQVIRIFNQIKDPDLILPLFIQLSNRKDYNPNESIYSTVINKLSAAGDFDGVETIMQRIKLERRCRLSDALFRDVIKIYGHSAGRINKAVETLFDMPNYKCWPSVVTFNCVLNLLVSTKKFETIHEVYARAPSLCVEVDACCLNIIIKGLCECGKIEAALNVLDEFPKQKCVPNVRSFSTIMHGLCELGRVDEAFGLLDRMESEGVEVDAIVFNTLILGLRKQKRFREGIELFNTAMVKGCKPNPGTYQEVLYCFLDAKCFLEAKNFMQKMIEKGINPSFESYKLVIKGFCCQNLAEDVEWSLKEMVRHGFVPKMGMWKQIVRCVLSTGVGIDTRCVCVYFDEIIGK
ncbi:small ribosomal subunit protein mL103 (rPPR7) [Henckelia pumila]|uniref:small ribosomal subunit protein mL103 (rPPR7) n=1 Tax=Henckelia pumila TaxID=405737 RepID=UPI003C6E2AA5